MISSLASPQITAHACGADDDAPQTKILFFRWVTLTERYRIIFRERRRPRDAGFQFPRSLTPIIKSFPFIMAVPNSGGYLLSQFFPGVVCFRCIKLCAGFPASPEF
jgi:hypothetical protein